MAEEQDWAALADGELARLVAASGPDAGNAEAELCRRFARRIRLYGLHHLRDASDAEDLAQRVLLLMLQKLRGGAVREPDSIGSFVLGVARMLVKERRRGASREVAVSAEGEELPRQAPVEPDPFAPEHLARCLQALAERERSILVLTYYGEAGSSDIAAALALAEGHVRVLRHRAIGRLRDCLGVS